MSSVLVPAETWTDRAYVTTTEYDSPEDYVRDIQHNALGVAMTHCEQSGDVQEVRRRIREAREALED